MNSKHTPGPWVVGAQLDHLNRLTIRCQPRDGHLVALVELPSGGPAEMRATAALIAAAPDLLAACEAALTEFESWEPDADPMDPAEVVKETLRAALTRVKGATP